MKSSGLRQHETCLLTAGQRGAGVGGREAGGGGGPDLSICCFLPVLEEAGKENKASADGSQTLLMHF